MPHHSPKKNPRQPAERHPLQAFPETHFGDAVEIIEQAGREERVELAKKNDAGPLLGDRAVQRRPARITQDALADEFPSELVADKKSHRRAEQISDQHQQRTPPQPEKKSSAQAQNSTRQEQHCGRHDEQGIDHDAHRTPATNHILCFFHRTEERRRAREINQRTDYKQRHHGLQQRGPSHRLHLEPGPPRRTARKASRNMTTAKMAVTDMATP